jgi:uncharacterized protein YjbJ (UPF0337 family)
VAHRADVAACFYPPSDECRDFAGVQLAPRIFSTALLSAEAIKLRAPDRRRANSSRGGIGWIACGVVAPLSPEPSPQADLNKCVAKAFSCYPQFTGGNDMDWDRVEGNWKQFKGQIKEQWGKLTDDDLDQIAGKRDQLEGKIQERYGLEKDRARQDVDDWFGRQTW